jgi:polyhydroxyalkanoate synthesis regulator phasin
MTQKQPEASDWISSWIEQQRRLLQETAGSQPLYEDLGKRWLELGEAYLSGLAQYGAVQGSAGAAANSGAAASGFKLGDDIVAAWRNAWAGAEQEQAGMRRRLAELADRIPFLGVAREQAEAWRELNAAQMECRRLSQELIAVLARVQTDALSLLEQRAREREQAGQPVKDFRALYDLWVECGEHVYAQVAHSEAYCKLQAELGNATMRLRARQQTVMEHALRQFDLPTRTELNTVHRQIRELRSRLAAMEALAPERKPARAAKRASSSRKNTAKRKRR